MFRSLLIVLFALSGVQASSPPVVDRLDRLSDAGAWRVEGSPGSSLFPMKGWVGLNLDLLKDPRPVRVMLNEPVTLPEGARMFVFRLGSDGVNAQTFLLKGLIRDSRGVDYAYRVASPLIRGNENYIFANQPSSWRPLRVTLPGLTRQAITPYGSARRDSTIEIMRSDKAAGGNEPVPPLQFVGFEIAPIQTGSSRWYFGDFVASDVSPVTAKLHYLFNDEEAYAETDGLPSVTVGLLGPRMGGIYRYVWTVRDAYAGQPFLSGQKTVAVNPGAPDFPSALAEKIEFPVTEKGVYWVTVRRYWSPAVDKPAEKIDEQELRLDVLAGAEAKPREPLAGPIPGSAIRIAPTAKEMIFDPKVSPNLEILITPEKPAPDTVAKVRLRTTASGALAAEKEYSIPESGLVSMPISDIPAGAYLVEVELWQGGRLVDRADGRVGVLLADDAKAVTAPDPSADWRKLTGGKSLVYFGMQKRDLTKPVERMRKVKETIDQVSTITNLLEYETTWADLEPMPGVYDWSELDEAIAYARSKGMTVLIWPSFVGGEPDWIPADFQRKQDGTVTGTKSYLFQGGRMNFWHSEKLQQSVLNLLKAMADRYRGNPGVHGYYMIVEHGGDNPWYGFFPGYEKETLADYREYLKEKSGGAEALSARWGAPIADFSQVGPPQADATDRERLDWYVFRNKRLEEFFIKAVRTIRQEDPYKLVMVYTGAADGGGAQALAELGCMLADGGAAVPEQGGSRSMGYAEQGLGRRTEEISVGRWSAVFPTQIDATLYNLTLGGGVNANCKMFYPVGKSLAELRHPPFSLDRFEKFIPIWNELAPTKAMPRQSYMLLDSSAAMLQERSTLVRTEVWADIACFDAHVPSPAVPFDVARKGKLIFVPHGREFVEKSMARDLVSYVENGGTLVMTADSGRRSPDVPGEDWYLLRQLGIQPPASDDLAASGSVKARLKDPAVTEDFSLRDAWKFAPQSGEVLAEYSFGPAITRHPLGKGSVVVIWADTIIPPTEGGGYPFLKQIARDAGVEIFSDASTPNLWTNLLANPETGAYYALVYQPAWTRYDRPPANGRTFWKVADGQYQVTELISGRDVGEISGSDLLTKGLEVSLKPREVAIYRLSKK